MDDQRDFIHKLEVFFSVCYFAAEAVKPYQPSGADPFYEPWRLKSFLELEGQGVRCLAEDGEGAIWFGVTQGVQKFDGIGWSAFGSAEGLWDAPVNAICIAIDGKIYAGSSKGISCYDEGIWKQTFPPEGHPPWNIRSLTEISDGSIWAGTDLGALRIDSMGMRLYSPASLVSIAKHLVPGLEVVALSDETALVSKLSDGFGALASGGHSDQVSLEILPVVILHVVEGGPAESAGLLVGDLLVDVPSRDGLAGVTGTKIALKVLRTGSLDTLAVEVERGQLAGKLPEFAISDVCESKDGSLWFGLEDGGVSQIRTGADGREILDEHLYHTADGLDVGRSTKLLQRQNGDIWMIAEGSQSRPNRFDGRKWTSVSLVDLGGTNTNTSIMETQDGALWINGLGSLALLQNDHWKIYHGRRLGLPDHRGRMIEASDGAVWIAGLGESAVRLDYGNGQWQAWDELIFQCEAPDGSLWFLTREGEVVQNAGTTWTKYDVSDGLMDKPVGVMATRKGQIWVVGSQGSAAATARLDGNRWTMELHPALGWSIDWRSMYESLDGSIWFGSQSGNDSAKGHLGGILQWVGDEWIHHVPPDAPTAAYGVVETSDGYMWFGCHSGLKRYDGHSWSLPHIETLKANLVSKMGFRETEFMRFMHVRMAACW